MSGTFLSYARENGDFALRLGRDLKAAGVDVWIDQLAILGGEIWDHAVQEALEGCSTLLIVLSPDAIKSRSVMDEVSFALDEGKRVVPVVYRACKTPFRLRRVQYVDFTGDYAQGLSHLTALLAMLARTPPPPPPPGRPSSEGRRSQPREAAVQDVERAAADLAAADRARREQEAREQTERESRARREQEAKREADAAAARLEAAERVERDRRAREAQERDELARREREARQKAERDATARTAAGSALRAKEEAKEKAEREGIERASRERQEREARKPAAETLRHQEANDRAEEEAVPAGQDKPPEPPRGQESRPRGRETRERALSDAVARLAEQRRAVLPSGPISTLPLSAIGICFGLVLLCGILVGLSKGVVVRLEIDPDSLSMAVGDTATLQVRGWSLDDSIAVVSPAVSWWAEDSSVAGLVGSRVDARGAGTTSIWASYDGLRAFTVVTVRPNSAARSGRRSVQRPELAGSVSVTSSIEGYVRDQSGAPVANAQVFIEGSPVAVVTDQQGRFRIQDVPVGVVVIRARVVGYQQVRQQVRVSTGQASTVNLTLPRA